MGSLTVSGIVRITRDSEVRKTSSGSWYSFGVAAFRRNVKEGKQTADFFDADLYMKDEKNDLLKTLVKGRLLYIENAFLRNDQFKGTDGKEKSKVKLMINAWELLNDKIETKSEEKKPEVKVAKPAYTKPTDAVSKIKLNTTAPSELPPPMAYNAVQLDVKPSEETMVEVDFEDQFEDEVPF